MGVGRASGKDKARVAAEMAINSPLLETSINGAMGVIANIVASPDIALDEVYTASELISDAAHPDVNLIWGVAYDENLDDEILVTVIATGFERADEFGVSNYIKDIAGYKPKDNTTAKVSAVQAAPAAAVRPVAPAPAPEPVVQPQQPNIFAEEETPEEDPYEVIMRMFGRGKK